MLTCFLFQPCRKVYESLVAKGDIVPQPEVAPPTVPMDYNWARVRVCLQFWTVLLTQSLVYWPLGTLFLYRNSVWFESPPPSWPAFVMSAVRSCCMLVFQSRRSSRRTWVLEESSVCSGSKRGQFLPHRSLPSAVSSCCIAGFSPFRLPMYAAKFLEMCLMVTADHGPAVSGAHNTIVCARAGKDLISSLASGLFTIVSYSHFHMNPVTLISENYSMKI